MIGSVRTHSPSRTNYVVLWEILTELPLVIGEVPDQYGIPVVVQCGQTLYWVSQEEGHKLRQLCEARREGP